MSLEEALPQTHKCAIKYGVDVTHIEFNISSKDPIHKTREGTLAYDGCTLVVRGFSGHRSALLVALDQYGKLLLKFCVKRQVADESDEQPDHENTISEQVANVAATKGSSVSAIETEKNDSGLRIARCALNDTLVVSVTRPNKKTARAHLRQLLLCLLNKTGPAVVEKANKDKDTCESRTQTAESNGVKENGTLNHSTSGLPEKMAKFFVKPADTNSILHLKSSIRKYSIVLPGQRAAESAAQTKEKGVAGVIASGGNDEFYQHVQDDLLTGYNAARKKANYERERGLGYNEHAHAQFSQNTELGQSTKITFD